MFGSARCTVREAHYTHCSTRAISIEKSLATPLAAVQARSRRAISSEHGTRVPRDRMGVCSPRGTITSRGGWTRGARPRRHASLHSESDEPRASCAHRRLEGHRIVDAGARDRRSQAREPRSRYDDRVDVASSSSTTRSRTKSICGSRRSSIVLAARLSSITGARSLDVPCGRCDSIVITGQARDPSTSHAAVATRSSSRGQARHPSASHAAVTTRLSSIAGARAHDVRDAYRRGQPSR